MFSGIKVKNFIKNILGIISLIFIISGCVFWANSVLLRLDVANAEIRIMRYQLSSIIEYLGRASPEIIIPVIITAYSPTPDQCDSTPLITASNQKVRTGIIALSRDIEKEFNLKFGDRVEIIGYGVFEFQDRMNKRWKRKVDIFFWERNRAIQFGKKYGKIKILKEA